MSKIVTVTVAVDTDSDEMARMAVERLIAQTDDVRHWWDAPAGIQWDSIEIRDITDGPAVESGSGAGDVVATTAIE